MKFLTLEANKLFTLAIYADKQINKADEFFSKEQLNKDSIIDFRQALNEHIENSKKQIDLISKQYLKNAYRSISNDV